MRGCSSWSPISSQRIAGSIRQSLALIPRTPFPLPPRCRTDGMKGKRGAAPSGLMECEAGGSAKQGYSGDGGESSTACGGRQQHRWQASSQSTPSDLLLCSFQFGVLYYSQDRRMHFSIEI